VVPTWNDPLSLGGLGAVAIKNSVYALPKNDSAYEDMQWVLQEIVKGGGDASLCEANFVDGLTDQEIEALFPSPRSSATSISRTISSDGKTRSDSSNLWPASP